MSITVTRGPEDFCFEGCPFIDLKFEKNNFYSNWNVIEFTNSILTCTNERVCKMWNDRTKNI